ncbi:MAG: hypothetical protein NTZ86_05400 [Legionellales bacterium]|nr:hypothetical protein [Legionellales bacterium]
MTNDQSKKRPSRTEYKPPANYADDKSLSVIDRDLVVNLELCETEFLRYKHLEPYKKAGIIQLLTERKRLNDYVKNYLQEEINKQFGPFMQLLFPTEHSLKYALQKVDEIEDKINTHLEDDELHVFDIATTRRNRTEILLTTAYSYLRELDIQIAKTGRSALKGNALVLAEQKREDLHVIIEELHKQLDHSEYFVHNESILSIKDTELSTFINKLKTIGIGGFTPRANKYQPTFFGTSIINAIYEKLNPKPENEDEESKLNPHKNRK